ncbi:MAG: SpaA isopeptide-forming pilin-related protein, partial [Peptostreptococcus anaerobius]|nr:SpaA isopeptide-forming pilin-related protein [Peptostreptococcus anaerobius]
MYSPLSAIADQGEVKYRAYTSTRNPEFVEIEKIGDTSNATEVGYCLNYSKAYPKIKDFDGKHAEYTKSEDNKFESLDIQAPNKDDLYDNLRRVLYNGYPTDGAHLVEYGKISASRLRYLTQYAVWHYTDGKTADNFNLSGTERKIFEELINSNSEELRKVPDDFKPSIFQNDTKIMADRSKGAHKPYFQNLISSPKSDNKTYDIYAQKIWEGMNNKDKPDVLFELQDRITGNKVELTGDGNENPKAISVSKDSDKSDLVVWKNLKKSPDNYKVVEKYKENHEANAKKYISSELNGNGRKESPYSFTNMYDEAIFISKIDIHKKWENTENKTRPELYIGIYRKSQNAKEELVTKDMLPDKKTPFDNPIKLSEARIFSKNLPRLNLPIKVNHEDPNSDSYIYYVRELQKKGDSYVEWDQSGYTSTLEANRSKANNPIFTFTNTYKGEFKINISKKAISGEDELSGADLRVLNEKNEVVSSWTSSNKPKTLTLKSGKYKLVEDAAPAGYQKVSVFDFSVDENGELKLDNQPEGVSIDNTKNLLEIRDKEEKQVNKVTVKINKVDDKGAPVSDVEMKILRADDNSADKTDNPLNEAKNLVSHFITKGSNKEIMLEEGKYKLEEVFAPDTHEKIEKEIYFEVKNNAITLKDGDSSNIAKVEEGNKLTIINKKKETPTPDPGGGKVKVSIRKYASDDTSKLLTGANLELYKAGEGNKESLVKEGSFTSDDKGKVFELEEGHYVLKENTPPSGYEQAEEIKFQVVEGKVYIGGKEKGEEAVKESIEPYSYEAFKDFNDDNTLGTVLYGKNYYIKQASKNQVVYCFNAGLNEPANSYDNGNTIEYEESIGIYKVDGTYTKDDFKYTKMDSNEDLRKYTVASKNEDKDTFNNSIKRVLFAGYPNLKAGIDFKNLNDTGKRAATQLAIYHFTDKLDIDEIKNNQASGPSNVQGKYHGFDAYGVDVLDVAQSIVDFAKSSEEKKGLESFNYNFYVSSFNKFQNLIGTEYDPADMLYVVKMIDEKVKPKPEEKSVTIQVSKLNFAGEEIPGASIKIYNEKGDKLAKGKIDNNQDEVDLTWTSDKTAKNITIKPGTYVFKEEAAPNGYKKVTDIKFTVDQDGKVSLNTTSDDKFASVSENKLSIKDDASDGKLRTTVSANGTSANDNKPVELNATDVSSKTVKVVDTVNYEDLQDGESYTIEARLIDVTGNQEREIKKVTTESNLVVNGGKGQWTVDLGDVNLEPGHKYVVYEVATSANKLKLNKQGTADNHVIRHENKDDDAQTIVVKAKEEDPQIEPKKDVTIQVSKLNFAGEEIPGASIKIYNADGVTLASGKLDNNQVEGNLSWISGNDAKNIVMKPGTYIFREEVAPEGYKLVTEITFDVTKDGKVLVKGLENLKNVETIDGHLKVKDDAADGTLKTTVGIGNNKASKETELKLKPEEVKDKLEVVDTVSYENLQPGE